MKDSLNLSYLVVNPSFHKVSRCFNQEPHSFLTAQFIILLHGMFGSKKTMHPFGKVLAEKFGCSVVLADLRNHGESPRSHDMGYFAMADDVALLIENLNTKRARVSQGVVAPLIIGHSMGGKVAYCVALRHSGLIAGLIALDVTPIGMGKVSTGIQYSMELMQTIEKMAPKTPEDALICARDITSKGIVTITEKATNYLLTNYNYEMRKFQIPIDIISQNLLSLAAFPEIVKIYNFSILIIGGGKSKYVQPDMLPEILKLFPQAKLIIIPDSGHWLHSDQEEPLLEILNEYISNWIKSYHILNLTHSETSCPILLNDY